MKIGASNFSYKKVRIESAFKRSLIVIALCMIIIAAGIFLTLVIESIPSLKALGIKYLWGRVWDPVTNIYGGLPFLIGTLMTSFLALVVIVPIVRNFEVKIGAEPYGVGIFTASLILAIMIIPYAASLGRELIRLVPGSLKEGAYSLGANRVEVLK